MTHCVTVDTDWTLITGHLEMTNEKKMTLAGKTRHELIWLVQGRSCGQKFIDASECDDVSTRPRTRHETLLSKWSVETMSLDWDIPKYPRPLIPLLAGHTT